MNVDHPTNDSGSFKNYWAYLLLIVFMGIVLRVAFDLADQMINHDLSTQLEAGRNIWKGNGFARNGMPELHFPPLGPFLLGGLWELIGNPLLAVGVLIVATGALVLVVIAAVARQIGGDQAGLAAAGIGAFAPALSWVPVDAGGTESLNLVLILSGMLLVIHATRTPFKKGVLLAGGAGILIGMAYLTRPESLLVAGALGLLLLVGSFGIDTVKVLPGGRIWLRPALKLGAYLATLCLVAAPYLVYLHGQSGEWALTAKAQDFSMTAWRGLALGDRRLRDEHVYRLDSSGTRFFGVSSLGELIKGDPKGYARIVLINVKTFLRHFPVPTDLRLIPTPAWPLLPAPIVALGLWAAWKNRSDPIVVALACLGTIVAVTALGFAVQARYVIPVAAVLVVTGGVGLAQLPARLRRLGWGVVMVSLIGPLMGAVGVRGGIWDKPESVELRYAGEWLGEQTNPNDLVMTRSMIVRFYSGREVIPVPYTELATAVAFGNHYGARYLVADELTFHHLRPQLADLFGIGPWPGLKLLKEFTYQGRKCRIFSFDPFNQSPEPTPPKLGYVGDQ